MSFLINEQEYYDICYKCKTMELRIDSLLNTITDYEQQIQKLSNLLNRANKIINNKKEYAVSVSPDGDIAFGNDFIKDEIHKSIIKEIISSETLQELYEKTDKINHNFTSMIEAIKRQDGIIVERSIEIDTEEQLEKIRNEYTIRFMKDLKNTNQTKYKEILSAAAEDISSKITLPDKIEYRGIGDPIYEEYSKYIYTIKGGDPTKKYKVKGISYTNTSNKSVKSATIKLIKTILSGEEIVVKSDQLIREQFRQKIDVQTTNTRTAHSS